MRSSGLTAALLVLAARLAAQSDCSSVAPVYRRSCDQAVDAYKTLQPLAGIAISGGGPELGTAHTLGGLGHVFVSARVNAVKATVPNPDTTQAAISGTLPAPIIEGGIGLARGLGSGLLAVDALAAATLLPTNLDKFSVDPSAARVGSMALGVGYGFRVGILNGGFPIPSVSLSWMHRTLPRVRFGNNVTGSDNYEVDTDLAATNVRLAASMRLLLFDVAAGVGVDHYTSTADIYSDGLTHVTVPLANTRQVLFLDAGLDLATAKLVAELGYQTGKDQQLTTNYSEFDPKAGHVFGGIGLRFGF